MLEWCVNRLISLLESKHGQLVVDEGTPIIVPNLVEINREWGYVMDPYIYQYLKVIWKLTIPRS